MAEWMVGLEGDDVDLDALVAEFDRPELSVDKVAGQYWLRSTEFQPGMAADDIRAKAGQLVQRVNGVASVTIGGYHMVGVGHVLRFHEDGRRDAFVYVGGVLEARGRVLLPTVVGGAAMGPPRPSPTAALDALAAQDIAVRDAVRYWSQRNDNMAVNLYKIWELIGHDLIGPARLWDWNAAIESQGWATHAETDGFRSVHFRTLLGDDARHAVPHGKVPATPLSLDDAERLVKRVMRAWLRSKGWSG